MGLFKKIKRAINKVIPNEVKPFAAPLTALAAGPAGLGLTSGLLGSTLVGAGTGALVGKGGLKGALSGALGGAAIGGAGSALGSSLGVYGQAGKALGGGLLGAASGGISGGLKGALAGGALGAGAGYFANPSLSDLNMGDYGMFLDEFGPTLRSPSIWDNIGSVFNGGSTFGGGISNALSTLGSIYANKSAEDDLLEGQNRSLDALSKYMDPEFDSEDFRTDPGYQFRLTEGQRAIDRGQSARGGFFSGAALKAAQEYGQGLADQEYEDSFNRWLQEQNQGVNVASRVGDIYQNQGNIKANSTVNSANALTGGLSRALTGNPNYYRDQYGRLILM